VNRLPIAVLSAAAAAALVTGCGGSSDKPAPSAGASNASATGTTTTPAAAYDPKVVPSDFTTKITNRYWPLKPGTKWVYSGTKDGAPERVEVTVTNKKKTVMGIPTVVVSDVVTSNYTLTEKTTDWYAQNKKTGDIWYFGEDTKEYKNGVVTSTAGTWEAGVDNAKPGVTVQGNPKPGGFYRQEYRPGVAEDMAQVLSTHTTQTAPAGTFKGVLETFDKDPLNPDKKEHKWYAPGTGPVHVIRFGSAHHEEIRLVKKS
jgi:hypothetical protein